MLRDDHSLFAKGDERRAFAPKVRQIHRVTNLVRTPPTQRQPLVRLSTSTKATLRLK